MARGPEEGALAGVAAPPEAKAVGLRQQSPLKGLDGGNTGEDGRERGSRSKAYSRRRQHWFVKG